MEGSGAGSGSIPVTNGSGSEAKNIGSDGFGSGSATMAKTLLVVTGAQKLVAKIKEYNPKIAVFNGKGIYEVFSGQKEFIFGKQPDKITDTETVSVGKA
jgi:mismatch-specific thymine-DNA glycosylase